MFGNSPTPEASSAVPAARPARRRHGRLTAICTSGVLAASALVLGQAGLANADAPASHTTVQPTHKLPSLTSQAAPSQRQLPTLTLPQHKQALSSVTTNATTALRTTPWFDIDGDGVRDIITQEADRSVLLWSSSQPADTAWQDLGTATAMYKDLLTPGNLTDTLAGPEVLTLTTTGKLSMWDNWSFPTGYTSWTGSGWNIYNKVVAIGDVTGDGFGDLLARTPSGDLYLYRSTGSATAPFHTRIKVGYGYGAYDQLIGGGDLTATGNETLVARDLSGDLWMYTIDGTKAQPLSSRVKIGYGWNIYTYLIGFGDDQGQLGNVTGRTAGGDLYRYEGNGTGRLGPRNLYGSGWTDRLVADRGSTPMWGKNDLFALTPGGSLYYYYGTGRGTLSARSIVGNAGDWKPFYPIGSASLTQADEEPLLEIFQGTLMNDTDIGYGIIGTGWDVYNRILGPGDLNNDGNGDLLARDKSGVLWLATGRGTGTTFYGRAKVGAGWNTYNQITGAGDINGDGFADIVGRAANGHLYLYLGTGSGKAPFKPRIDVGAGWNAYTKLIAPGDLDGDGRADICAVTSGGLLYRYSGSGHTGTATFKPRVKIGTSGWNSYSAIV